MQIAKLVLTGTLLLSLAVPVLANPAGNPTHIPHHPRVNQVNKRFARQNKRENRNEKSGLLTRKQRHTLNHQDHGLKSEEHTMRKDDHGHLTKADHKALNQGLHHQSKEIKHDRKEDK
ncbi:MAG TPA: hypothetical protein VGO93_20450 [Candidatus Xenobia bacterium]